MASCREEGMPALSEDRQAVPLEEAAQRALHGKARKIPLEQAEGEISAEYVMAYPPGIPLLIPGERISAEDIRTIRNLQREKGISGALHRDRFLTIPEKSMYYSA